MVERAWSDFYRGATGNRLVLEGNILEHAPLVLSVAKYVKPGDSVLEIGSGTGVLGWPLAQAGIKVVSVDNDPGVLKECSVNAKLVGADITYIEADGFCLPFSYKEFKVSFSLGLLEHFSDDDICRLVQEHKRVADNVVVGVPLKGNRSPSFGNERYLTAEEWLGLLVPLGCSRWFNYGTEVIGCFIFERS